MKSTDIERYLNESTTSFRNTKIVGPGIGYHYTVHANAIEKAGKFLGAPLSEDLDCTQDPNKPNVASSDPGVVFAYAELADAAEEGDSARFMYPGSTPELFEIKYSSAVEATHIQEAELDAPPTILISSVEITSLKRMGPCSDNYEENAA